MGREKIFAVQAQQHESNWTHAAEGIQQLGLQRRRTKVNCKHVQNDNKKCELNSKMNVDRGVLWQGQHYPQH